MRTLSFRNVRMLGARFTISSILRASAGTIRLSRPLSSEERERIFPFFAWCSTRRTHPAPTLTAPHFRPQQPPSYECSKVKNHTVHLNRFVFNLTQTFYEYIISMLRLRCTNFVFLGLLSACPSRCCSLLADFFPRRRHRTPAHISHLLTSNPR